MLPSRESNPYIQIRIAREAPVAVVVVRHSWRYSRIFHWDLVEDAFWPGQWLKGWIELLDVSPCGRYVAYSAKNERRMAPSYLAVSRPPYLTALFFQPVSVHDYRTLRFRSAERFDWFGTPISAVELGDRPEAAQGYVRTGCPFEIRRNFEPGDFQREEPDAVLDPHGRILRDHRGRVYADGVEMLDLRVLGRPNLAAPEEMRRW